MNALRAREFRADCKAVFALGAESVGVGWWVKQNSAPKSFESGCGQCPRRSWSDMAKPLGIWRLRRTRLTKIRYERFTGFSYENAAQSGGEGIPHLPTNQETTPKRVVKGKANSI